MSKWYEEKEIKDWIDIAIKLHRNFINIGLALGIRASVTGMKVLRVKREEIEKAEVWGVKCFGEAVEVMTGCKLIRDKLVFHEIYEPPLKTKLILWTNNKKISLELIAREFKDADEVFNAPEEEVFKEVKISKITN